MSATAFEIVLFTLASLFLLGALDDVIIDIVHMLFRLAPEKITPQKWKSWRARKELPLAIMIPAWNEEAVLEAMVETNLARIKYQNFHWFIGVYPNDPGTLEVANRLHARHPAKVTVIVNNLPGPTSKAQCLNVVLNTIFGSIDAALMNGEKPWIPAYLAIHDAEDVIHPDAFLAVAAKGHDEKLDFMQMPIYSMPVDTKKWVAGTYLDEFADVHLREIPARQKLRMPIPSAGVGTFFSFEIMQTLRKRFKTFFEEGNLTEDYEISMKIARLGAKQRFLLLTDEHGDVVSTREYFPDEFGRSVRQKARWTTGIGLQTMAKWGWFGKGSGLKGLLARYGLWRDRKAIWLNPFSFLGWAASSVVTVLSISSPQWWSNLQYPRELAWLMGANLFLLGWRFFQRARFTTKLYGLKHGAYSLPRAFIAAIINGLSAVKALRLYREASKKGKNPTREIKWDKTPHVFPSAETIARSLERPQ